MRILKDDKAMCLSDLKNKLVRKEGILIEDSSYHGPIFLKSFSNDPDHYYGWVTLWFNRGKDCSNMGVVSIDGLIEYIVNSTNNFFWFSSMEEAIQWLYNKKIFGRREKCQE